MTSNFQCNICGEKFDKLVDFCPGCGADKKNFILLNSTENDSQIKKKDADKKQENVDKKSKHEKKSDNSEKPKTISTTKIIYSIIGLFLFGSIILVSSGIFDKPAPVQSNATVNADPNNPHAGHDLTQLERITELQKTVDANPNDLNSLLDLAHLLNDSGFKEKAIERYEQYIKKNSKVADVWVDMGVCYYELGKNIEAISKMEKALTIEPKHQIAHLNLGIVNFSSGNKEKALTWWKKALEINPNSEIGKRAQELINQH